MLKRFTAIALVLASIIGAVGMSSAGAADVHQTLWFLGGTRACYSNNYLTERTGIGHLVVDCYNDNDTAMVRNIDVWYPDYLWVNIDVGNGVGAQAVVSLLPDNMYPGGYPATNTYTPVYTGIKDVDSWVLGGNFKVISNAGAEFWHGPASWGGATYPWDSGSWNNNGRMDFIIN